MREVIIKFQAYKEMIKYFSQFSSNKIPRDGWVESMGFLFCNVEGDYYIIEDAIGMASGSELDVSVSPMSLRNLPQLERDHGGFTGGWWHTHPGLTPFFSETDIKNQVFYQTNNIDGLGIVWDHSMISKDYIGFQIFRLEHQFSEEYNEVAFQLQGFPKEGLRECMELLGIDEEITEALVEKYGGKGAALRIDFSRLGEPIVDEPLGDAEWLVMEAVELMEEEKVVEAIKKYKMAEIVLNGTEHLETYMDILSTLIKLCADNNFLENAKEEFSLFEEIKEKVDPKKFREYHEKLSQLIKDK